MDTMEALRLDAEYMRKLNYEARFVSAAGGRTGAGSSGRLGV